jgi:hypothetical protein
VVAVNAEISFIKCFVSWYEAEMRLIDFFGDIKNVQFSVAHDKMYVDALGQELNDIDEFIWTDLASGQKNEMDSAFTTLLMKSLK